MHKYVPIILATILLPNIITSLPTIGSITDSLLIVSTESAVKIPETKREPQLPNLKSMHVISNIRNRYANTMVSSRYVNPEETSQEATFTIVLPDSAFISGFVMEIKDKKYEAYVREKEEAKQEYKKAVKRGQTAGHVAVNARDSNTFTVSVNVEPLSKVTFNLTYEQLLARKHGKYEMVINLHPGQLVKDLKVDVNINETRRIVHIDTPDLRSGNKIIDPDHAEKNNYAIIEKVGSEGKHVHVRFSPTIEQQKEIMKKLCNKKETKGIEGQFVVEYDVERDPQGGEVLVNDGYFVHFFAPSELKPIPKHVMFVLDVSGSMGGRKINQLRKAMQVILSELNPEDYFSIIKFHSNVQAWSGNNTWINIEYPLESPLPAAYSATAENVNSAKQTIEKMQDEGLTNIYDALRIALRMTSKGVAKEQDNKRKPQPIIIFLTDGEANVGESRTDKIVEMVSNLNVDKKKAALFTLGFGTYANKDLLTELALKNSGFMRQIYEDSDAALQLQDFYKQISSPLLTDVNFKYSENKVNSLTKHNFQILFKGSELVVAGRVKNPTEKFVTVHGLTAFGANDFYPEIFPIFGQPQVKEEYGSLERLWAYMTIKQLLDKKYEEKDVNTTNSETYEKQALELALKYSFVTSVSSLIVVKPNDTEPVDEQGKRLADTYGVDSDYDDLSLISIRISENDDDYDVAMIPLSLPPIEPDLSTPSRPGMTSPSPPVSFTSAIPQPQPQLNLPWLTTLYTGQDTITIDNKQYQIGNNQTSVDSKPCTVQTLGLSGNCTLLSACPRIYSTLDSLETYRKFFCTLKNDKFAGVCCTTNTYSKNELLIVTD